MFPQVVKRSEGLRSSAQHLLCMYDNWESKYDCDGIAMVHSGSKQESRRVHIFLLLVHIFVIAGLLSECKPARASRKEEQP